MINMLPQHQPIFFVISVFIVIALTILQILVN